MPCNAPTHRALPKGITISQESVMLDGQKVGTIRTLPIGYEVETIRGERRASSSRFAVLWWLARVNLSE